MATGQVLAGNKVNAQDLLDEFSPAPATWTPTYTNITVGNGTVVAVYSRVDDWVDFRWRFTLGSTSAIGSGPRFTPPVTPRAAYYATDDIMGQASLYDLFTALYPGFFYLNGSSFQVRVINSAGTYGSGTDLTSTIPFTWGNGDVLSAWGRYIGT